MAPFTLGIATGVIFWNGLQAAIERTNDLPYIS
jgi:hypothetical protein